MDILKAIQWMKEKCPEHRKGDLGYTSLLSLETDMKVHGHPQSPEAHCALIALTIIAGRHEQEI